MYFVKISYSFDDDIVESDFFKTKELAHDELFRLLFDEVRIVVTENEEQVSIIPSLENTNLITLAYSNGDYAQYEVIESKLGKKA